MKKHGIVVMAVLLLAAACGGPPTDGGWLASGSGWYMFLQIQNSVGVVDYAYTDNGQVWIRHGTILVNSDNTVSIGQMVDGELKDCSACPFQMSNGNLVISYQYQSYTGSGTVSGQMKLSSADISTYNDDVQSLRTTTQNAQQPTPDSTSNSAEAACEKYGGGTLADAAISGVEQCTVTVGTGWQIVALFDDDHQPVVNQCADVTRSHQIPYSLTIVDCDTRSSLHTTPEEAATDCTSGLYYPIQQFGPRTHYRWLGNKGLYVCEPY